MNHPQSLRLYSPENGGEIYMSEFFHCSSDTFLDLKVLIRKTKGNYMHLHFLKFETSFLFGILQIEKP